jgi:hypothetical protein
MRAFLISAVIAGLILSNTLLALVAANGYLHKPSDPAAQTHNVDKPSRSNLDRASRIGPYWTPRILEHAFERLKTDAGLSDYGAAALVARWAAIESPHKGPADVNPGKDHAAGVNQALGPRKPLGYALWSLDQQLDYIIMIDLRQPSQIAAYAKLRSAKTAADGSIGASMYERAEGYARMKPYDYYTRKTPVQDVLKEIRRYRAATPLAS